MSGLLPGLQTGKLLVATSWLVALFPDHYLTAVETILEWPATEVDTTELVLFTAVDLK